MKLTDTFMFDSNFDRTRNMIWKQLLFQNSKFAKYQVDNYVRLLKSKNGIHSVDEMTTSVDAIQKKQIWEDAHEICHSCGGHVNFKEAAVEQFVRGDKAHLFPVHASCCKIREGLNPFEIIVSMKFGYWLMMEVQTQVKEYENWLEPLMNIWCEEEGVNAEVLLATLGTPYCGHEYKARTRDQLIYSVRRMYLDDRERPKYAVWNSYKHLEVPGVEAVVPFWDGKEKWSVYYERKKLHYKKFSQHRLQDQKNRGKGKPKDLKTRCWKRGGGVCHFCRGYVDEDCSKSDHIKPHSKGGDNGIWNFLPIHNMCNGLRSAYPASELITSMLLGRWMTQKIYAGVTDVTWSHNAVHYFLKEKLKKHYSGKERNG